MMTSNNAPHKGLVWQEKKREPKYLPGIISTTSVALSVYAMIFLGTINVALLYILWLPRSRYKRQLTIKYSKALRLPAAIFLYTFATTAWSDHPDLTIRIALEFGSVILCSLIISRIVRFESFLKGLTLGMFISLIAMIILGGGIHFGSAMTGGLGSKNQVGANAEIGVFASLMCFFMFKRIWQKLLLAIPALMLSTLCLYISKSSTSNLSMIAMIFICLITYKMAKVPSKKRLPLYIGTALATIILTAVSMTVNIQEVGLHAVGKDATLTGRTELWDAGIKAGMENPLFGVGIGAFWVVGNPTAERMWFKFDIPEKSGFHFHNLFINLFVELGVLGTSLWLICYLSTCKKAFSYMMKNGPSVESIFHIGMASMYLVRSFTESDTPGPYGTGPLLFFYTVIRVASRGTPEADKRDLPMLTPTRALTPSLIKSNPQPIFGKSKI